MKRTFTNVTRIGPVTVGTSNDRRGNTQHTCACTAPDCGWSTEYRARSAAELAARTHRCPAR